MIPKYQEHFEKLKLLQCPPPECKHAEMIAFRFCNLPLSEELNFLPQAIKIERGLIPPRRNQKPAEVCDDFGISLFDSKSNAVRYWKHIKSHIKAKLGYTHLSKGEIQKVDGVVTDVSPTGHFNLHEYIDSKCLRSFDLEVALP